MEIDGYVQAHTLRKKARSSSPIQRDEVLRQIGKTGNIQAMKGYIELILDHHHGAVSVEPLIRAALEENQLKLLKRLAELIHCDELIIEVALKIEKPASQVIEQLVELWSEYSEMNRLHVYGVLWFRILAHRDIRLFGPLTAMIPPVKLSGISLLSSAIHGGLASIQCLSTIPITWTSKDIQDWRPLIRRAIVSVRGRETHQDLINLIDSGDCAALGKVGKILKLSIE